MAEQPTGPESTPHQEIAELERILREKRQALAVEGRTAPERETFREAFRETYGEALMPKAPAPSASSGPAPPPALAPDETARHTDDLKSQEREEQLEALVAVAFSKGVAAAADLARRATPWFMDELHDRLCDRYYEHLLTARRLKAL